MKIKKIDNIMKEGYEAKWAHFLSEGKKVDFECHRKIYRKRITTGEDLQE